MSAVMDELVKKLREYGNRIERLEKVEKVTLLGDVTLPGTLAVTGRITGAHDAAWLWNSADVALVSSAYTTWFTFDTEIRDTGISGATDRITAPVAGWYFVYATGCFVANATGTRQAVIGRFNSANAAQEVMANSCSGLAGVASHVSVSGMMWMDANDYCKVRYYQDSGGNLNITKVATYTPSFQMIRVC